MERGIKILEYIIITFLITVIVAVVLEFRSCVCDLIFKVIYPKLIAHPFFSGVMISWLVAVSSIFIVSLFAYINRGKKEQYKEIFRQSETLLRGITVVVLFYLAIHLASKALYHPRGIPILGDPYAKHGFLNCISLQDIFLSSFVFFTIILLFWIAPYIIDKYKNIARKLLFVSVVLSLLIVFCILLFVPFNLITEPSLKDQSYLFSWDDVPGNDSKKLLKYLQTDHNINWTKSAEISKSDDGKVIYIVKDENSAEIMIDEEKEKATLKISNGETHNLKVKKEDYKLNIYDASSEGDWRLFGFIFVFSLILYPLIRKVKEIPKGIKGDFHDLLLIFCFLPAIIVASLVLAEDELVKFPNLLSNIVVGLLLISGFATLMSMVTISFKQGAVKPWHNPILLRSTLASLAAISGFCMFFLLFSPHLETEKLRTVLSFSVAINIIILLYGFLYEKLQRYHFTEWWRREYKPIAMIVSILLIAIVAAIDPYNKYTLLGWEIRIKLVFIFIVLIIGFCLPWIIMGFLRIRGFRRFLKGQIPKPRMNFMKLPIHQGMVLVKAKTDPGSLQEVVKGLDGMEGVYQTMVVRGEYDVCLIIEGLDYYEIEKKISEIRKIDGVADTTTLRDIREFFDREVR